MHGCRTEFTQGGVNKFTDYEVGGCGLDFCLSISIRSYLYFLTLQDDKLGERILKSGRSGADNE